MHKTTRKTLPILLILTLMVSLVALPAHAETAVIPYEDFLFDGDTLYGCWDSIVLDGQFIHEDGKAIEYCEDNDHLVVGPCNMLEVRGWMVCTQQISAFGYMIDDGQPVLSEDFFWQTEDAVVEIGASLGCDYASRFHIVVDTSEITGAHKITFLIQVEDGSVVTMVANSRCEVLVNYSADGSALPATPEPTEEPSGQDSVGPVFLCTSDSLMDGEFFDAVKNNIDEAYFDAERGCYVLAVNGEQDPYIYFPFGTLSMIDDSYTVDCEIYRYLQIGVRFNAPAMGESGQFFFQTDEYTNIVEQRSFVFKWQMTDEKQYVNINLGKSKYWKGVMIDSRLDPINLPLAGGDFEVYYMAFFTSESAAKEFGDKWLETGALDVPTPAPKPTKAPTEVPTEAPTPVPATEAPGVTDAPVTEPTKASSGDDADNKDDQTKKNGSVNPWLIIGPVLGVVAIAAVVTGILAGKKKKKG